MLSDNKIKILKSSSFYETLSWPNIKNPKFLNVVLEIETNLRPLSLLDLCKKIEKSLGRKKSKKNSPRVCDIDILDYGKRNENNGINLPNELKLDFIEPEYPKTVQDQILLDNHALQNNLTTQPELLVKQNKDLSIEEAREIVRANKQENEQQSIFERIRQQNQRPS